MHRLLVTFFLTFLLPGGVLAASVSETPERHFFALMEQVNKDKFGISSEKHKAIQEESKNITSCETASTDQSVGEIVQYIYNDVYSWTLEATANGYCVHLVRPIDRQLSIEEAETLIAASKMDFVVDPSDVSTPALPVEPQMGRGFLEDVEITEGGIPVKKRNRSITWRSAH